MPPRFGECACCDQHSKAVELKIELLRWHSLQMMRRYLPDRSSRCDIQP
jgi:hypothetical protein